MTEETIRDLYSRCMLCPRKCAVNRYEKQGFCKAKTLPKVSKAMLHMWEEPCLCKKGGSGAVFFSGCTLKCVFCQNYKISAEGFGKEISISRLSDIFLELEQKGAQNIDLITASHYLPGVIAALDKVKHKLKIPVVYNCGGYENKETIRMLSGYIDIYLPDIKYSADDAAVKYSSAPGYFDIACSALEEMIRQVGRPVFEGLSEDKEGLPDDEVTPLKSGAIVRHMVLPSNKDDSIAVINGLYERFGNDKFLISLLGQYTPFYKAKTDIKYKEINRRVTGYEYGKAAESARQLGFNGYVQERTSAKEEYTPEFDLEGV